VKFLFTVQGEGRGHYTQALSLSAILRKHGHEVAAVLVGTSESRQIPSFFKEKIQAPVYEYSSPNFTSFYKDKKPNIFLSVLNNFSRPFIYRKSLQLVRDKIEEIRPDVVINFYEMITGMVYQIYKPDRKLGIPMICLAHQYILLNNNYKTSREQDVKYYLLRMLSRITSRRASKILALSFRDISGYAEMIKHALIHSESDLQEILSFPLNDIDYSRLNELVFRSVGIKREIVEKDPFEKNIRKALNLGHTTAHAFESFAISKGSPILHGYAVAWGIIVELYLSHRLCGFPKDKLQETVRFIQQNYGAFDITCDNYEQLYEITGHDKKNQGGIINFTLLSDTGTVQIDQTADKELFFEALDFYRDSVGL
jgi:hypothetical protein